MTVNQAWEGDLLDYESIGNAFTNLIKSIDTAKVISIEAGFGRGKTFFRKAWSEQLRHAGETVVEIDVQQSDHSGDPVITLLGALVEAVPKTDVDKAKKALDSAKKIGAIGARAAAKVMLRSGADEIIDALSDGAIDALGDFDALDDIVNELGDGMSKAAGQLIAAQMATEKVRKVELPQQLTALHTALVQDTQGDRVVVVIDELDRCHPDYALAFLEAMKLIFSQSGFVFCLMVNADYLERLAKHRFGASTNEERYLEKFVDIRLSLSPKDDTFKQAIFALAQNLPNKIPYGDGSDFSIEHAAELASKLALKTTFSMRKVKRLLLKVEVALRCYADRPLDVSLLIYLAFKHEAEELVTVDDLPRAFLSPQEGENRLDVPEARTNASFRDEGKRDNELNRVIYEEAPELLKLPRERYQLPEEKDWKDWALVFKFLAPHYIPSHQAVLNAVATVLVSND
ncbi:MULTISPECIES: KAP family P-loop NTPase fold protein [Pacificibacter]|uniref:KAP family P-loop NTPase fold protein n=1 Tax=Pacificibacter TaxID=1042323 RepID=UPI001C0994EE|nr:MULTISPECIES: P-loop NTPase fold protein [Pacificibacter]MBU2934466.1 KAP family NTPase [Pacificibacter marinus]MDO6617212.1 P-loop NTPase fold protein [Pacificibacter sp. 1_MG-2023]